MIQVWDGEKLTFIASLPPIASAMNIDGSGDGGRFKLDVSREYAEALLFLGQRFTGKSFRVTIEPE